MNRRDGKRSSLLEAVPKVLIKLASHRHLTKLEQLSKDAHTFVHTASTMCTRLNPNLTKRAVFISWCAPFKPHQLILALENAEKFIASAG